MKRILLFVLVVLGLGLAVPRPAGAIGGMCAAAQFFNYESEFFNDLCWIEMELSAGQDPPDQHDYDYVP